VLVELLDFFGRAEDQGGHLVGVPCLVCFLHAGCLAPAYSAGLSFLALAIRAAW
jgi:hypothetical protein